MCKASTTERAVFLDARHITVRYITSQYSTSSSTRVTSQYVTLHRITVRLPRRASHHSTLHYITSHHSTSSSTRITSQYVTLHRITVRFPRRVSHHSTLHYITSQYVFLDARARVPRAVAVAAHEWSPSRLMRVGAQARPPPTESGGATTCSEQSLYSNSCHESYDKKRVSVARSPGGSHTMVRLQRYLRVRWWWCSARLGCRESVATTQLPSRRHDRVTVVADTLVRKRGGADEGGRPLLNSAPHLTVRRHRSSSSTARALGTRARPSVVVPSSIPSFIDSFLRPFLPSSIPSPIPSPIPSSIPSPIPSSRGSSRASAAPRC